MLATYTLFEPAFREFAEATTAMGKQSSSQPVVSRYKLHSVEPGDILFSTNPHSAESAAIRRATRSPFSHVALYRGELNFLEAADFGVLNFNYTRFGVGSDQNVRILRLREDVGVQAGAGERAAQAAEKYRGLDYWTPGAVMSAFKRAKGLINLTGIGLPTREKGFFCSFLVSQCYRDAGVELCPGLEPHQTNPGDLLGSRLLKDVTSQTLKSLPEYDNRPDAIDGAARVSPMQRVSMVERQVLVGLQNIIAKAGLPRVATIEDVLTTLMIMALNEDCERLREVDKQIAAELRGQDYALLPFIGVAAANEMAPQESGTINGKRFSDLSVPVLQGSLTNHREVLAKWNERLNDLEEEIEAGKELIKRTKLVSLMEWQRYLHNRSAALKGGIESIGACIRDLEDHLRTRKASGNS